MKNKILVIEDDKNISELIRLYLEKADFEVAQSFDGGAGVPAANDPLPPGPGTGEPGHRAHHRPKGIPGAWQHHPSGDRDRDGGAPDLLRALAAAPRARGD